MATVAPRKQQSYVPRRKCLCGGIMRLCGHYGLTGRAFVCGKCGSNITI